MKNTGRLHTTVTLIHPQLSAGAGEADDSMSPPAMLHLCCATARPKPQVNLLLSTGRSTLESPPHTPGSWVPEALGRPSATKPREQQGKAPATKARLRPDAPSPNCPTPSFFSSRHFLWSLLDSRTFPSTFQHALPQSQRRNCSRSLGASSPL